MYISLHFFASRNFLIHSLYSLYSLYCSLLYYYIAHTIISLFLSCSLFHFLWFACLFSFSTDSECFWYKKCKSSQQKQHQHQYQQKQQQRNQQNWWSEWPTECYIKSCSIRFVCVAIEEFHCEKFDGCIWLSAKQAVQIKTTRSHWISTAFASASSSFGNTFNKQPSAEMPIQAAQT